MWTTENRPRYKRDRLRYPSDLTDEEWALVKALIPPSERGGGKRRVIMRARIPQAGVHPLHATKALQSLLKQWPCRMVLYGKSRALVNRLPRHRFDDIF